MAIESLEQALLNGVDPEDDGARISTKVPHGEFLIMPATGPSYSGIKALTVAPANPARGLEKIQGIYFLVDSLSLAPLAVIDGTELTAVRTPAVTLLAIKHLAKAQGDDFPEAPLFLVFGAGVQATNHVRAAHSVFPQATFAVIGQRPERVQALLSILSGEGIAISSGTDTLIPSADVIICTTTATRPIFDGSLPTAGTIIASVGQHGLESREVDQDLVRRSDVVVEGREPTWHEAGDLIPARSIDEWRQLRPTNLRELVRGEFHGAPERPWLYNGVGMSWEDLVIATRVFEESASR